MQELFPESPLGLLPPSHAISRREAKVDPQYVRPLLASALVAGSASSTARRTSRASGN